MTAPHVPVMLNEVTEALNVKPGKTYIDATLGAGGHTAALIQLGATVYGVDQDELAIKLVNQRLHAPQLTCIQGNFQDLKTLLAAYSVTAVDGILFDLGVSSMQFDTPERGFSFQTISPLDMRMSNNLSVTAADLVNALSKKELVKLFTLYAQESRASRIADHIVRARLIKPITRTDELAGIVERAYGGRQGKLHPATKVFQALRIAVNDELGCLKEALPQALSLLKPAGRLVVISFHEGEDRIVKQFMKEQEEALEILTAKPLTPGQSELTQNPRARSAKLRIAQRK